MAYKPPRRPLVTLDLEVYRNYFLFMVKDFKTRRVIFSEQHNIKEGSGLDYDRIKHLLRKYTVVTFNGNGYDIPMLALALQGANCRKLKEASDHIIQHRLKPWDFRDIYEAEIPGYVDTIDLMEVAPGDGGLKLYGGRVHSRWMQDLPIEPDELITASVIPLMRRYCSNDNDVTIDLYEAMVEKIDLRYEMSEEYGIDLRSKSDAQIAEAVIRKQCGKILGDVVRRPEIPPGTSFKYEPPTWMAFTTPLLQQVLRDVRDADFFVADTGGVSMPKALDGRSVPVGNSVYRMGIGGLHSSEQVQAVIADENMLLIDRDVTSYYPSIILECNLAPSHLVVDNAFLRTYRSIVERRVEAKKRGDKVVADVLKIVANGSFGKLGSKYSALYAPKLLIQVTLTGQLALLMLIEKLESLGIRVVSGNTDGIVIHCHKNQQAKLMEVLSWWEKTTGFNTEETRYRAVFSRDVNNYIALKHGGGVKGKGAFAPVSISKNPQNTICVDAAIALVNDFIPIEKTIRECRDIRKFVTVRTVRGGAVQLLASKYDDRLTPSKKRDCLLIQGWQIAVPGTVTTVRLTPPGTLDTMGETHYTVESAYRKYCGEDRTRYIGKVVRFYIGKNATGALYYDTKNKTGGRNKVPNSDMAVPVMELPEEFPDDIDYDFYIRETQSILADIGATENARNKLLFGNL